MDPNVRELRLRVLTDVLDRKVSRLPVGSFVVTGDTQIGDHERGAYIAEAKRLIAAAWVMECRAVYRYDRDGVGVQLRLTTLGEVGRDRLAEAPSAVTA